MNYCHYFRKLGIKIKRERLRKNITQDELAFDSYLDRTYIVRLEKGKVNPSLKTLIKLSRGLKLKPWRLLKESHS